MLMGKMWTRGIGGIEVATLNSGEGGTLTATYNIPSDLVGAAAHLHSALQGDYYYAYNWFWNNTAN